jgi:S-adenosyl-L-methionine hydrolase (adenosine-forming)
MIAPTVALITDFGRDDSYVAELHLAIARAVPAARVVDVTHDLPPYDRLAAALVVERTLKELPRGAALAVVVDPGVGTSRARIALQHEGRWCVGPDNGVLPVLETRRHEVWRIDAITPREGVSTFDAREVFGPVAALLAAGSDVRLVGHKHPRATPWRMPADADFEAVGGVRYARGVVIARDRYGNAVTNLRLPADVDRTRVSVLEPPAFEGPLRASYGAVAKGERVALVGSSGRVELSVNQGATALQVGEEVVLRCDE